MVAGAGQNRCIISDGGSSTKDDLCDRVIVPYLKYKGFNEVLYWFVSHSDIDHISGLIEMLSDYYTYHIKVDNIVIPHNRMEDEKYDEIIRKACALGISIKEAQSLDRIETYDDMGNETSIYVLAPDKNMSITDHNQESMVLLIERADFQCILMGDIPMTEDRYVMDSLQKIYDTVPDIEVMQVSHHGSSTGTGEELLSVTDPEYAIISCARNNLYGHPHPELMKRLADIRTKILTTYENGAITFETDGQTMSVKCMR